MPTDHELRDLPPRLLSAQPYAVEPSDEGDHSQLKAFTAKRPPPTLFDTSLAVAGIEVNGHYNIFIGNDKQGRDVWGGLVCLDALGRFVCNVEKRATVMFWAIEYRSDNSGFADIHDILDLGNVTFTGAIAGNTLAQKFNFIYDALLSMVSSELAEC